MRLIDADELYEKLEKVSKEPDYQHEGEDWGVGLEIAMIETDVAPTINPEDLRPKGKWRIGEINKDEQSITVECSECDAVFGLTQIVFALNFNYCPNCGAKMEG